MLVPMLIMFWFSMYLLFVDVPGVLAGRYSSMIENIPSIHLLEFRVSDLTINFTADLYDDEKISAVSIDLLNYRKGESWKVGDTEIEDFEAALHLLNITWNSTINAYDVYVYEYGGEWVNHTVVRIGEENTTTYKYTTPKGETYKGKVKIYVESEKHIRIEWNGETDRVTEYLGIWEMDNERNQNATVFKTEKQEEARIIPVEMRPICIETKEAPTPEFTRPVIYIEIERKYFKLKNFLALQFVGCWSNLSITINDCSWFSIGNATAHAFVIPVPDWNTFDNARIEVSADNVMISGFVRVIYWWEDQGCLLFVIFYASYLAFVFMSFYYLFVGSERKDKKLIGMLTIVSFCITIILLLYLFLMAGVGIEKFFIVFIYLLLVLLLTFTFGEIKIRKD